MTKVNHVYSFVDQVCEGGHQNNHPSKHALATVGCLSDVCTRTGIKVWVWFVQSFQLLR